MNEKLRISTIKNTERIPCNTKDCVKLATRKFVYYHIETYGLEQREVIDETYHFCRHCAFRFTRKTPMNKDIERRLMRERRRGL